MTNRASRRSDVGDETYVAADQSSGEHGRGDGSTEAQPGELLRGPSIACLENAAAIVPNRRTDLLLDPSGMQVNAARAACIPTPHRALSHRFCGCWRPRGVRRLPPAAGGRRLWPATAGVRGPVRPRGGHRARRQHRADRARRRRARRSPSWPCSSAMPTPASASTGVPRTGALTHSHAVHARRARGVQRPSAQPGWSRRWRWSSRSSRRSAPAAAGSRPPAHRRRWQRAHHDDDQGARRPRPAAASTRSPRRSGRRSRAVLVVVGRVLRRGGAAALADAPPRASAVRSGGRGSPSRSRQPGAARGALADRRPGGLALGLGVVRRVLDRLRRAAAAVRRGGQTPTPARCDRWPDLLRDT